MWESLHHFFHQHWIVLVFNIFFSNLMGKKCYLTVLMCNSLIPGEAQHLYTLLLLA